MSEIWHRFFYLLRFHEKFLSLSICCCSTKLNRVQKHHGKRRRLSLTNIPWGILPFLEYLHYTKLPHALLPIPVCSRKLVKLIFLASPFKLWSAYIFFRYFHFWQKMLSFLLRDDNIFARNRKICKRTITFTDFSFEHNFPCFLR